MRGRGSKIYGKLNKEVGREGVMFPTQTLHKGMNLL
jgi:hypothetical protein